MRTNTGGSVWRQVVTREADAAEAPLQVHAFSVQTGAGNVLALVHVWKGQAKGRLQHDEA